MAGATRRSGERQTEQRRVLLAFLKQTDRRLSAQELHAELRDRGSLVSLATVYRTLSRLSQSGAVDVLLRDDGEATYVHASSHHHHHLACRSCGRVEEISEPMVESWTRDVARAHGFADVSHELTVFGTCSVCQQLHPQHA